MSASETIFSMCLQLLCGLNNLHEMESSPLGSNSTYHDIPVPISTQFIRASKKTIEGMIFPHNWARDMTELSRESHILSPPSVKEVFGYLKDLNMKSTRNLE
eukprot:386850-Heterocapsa_arctica.AAC.1